MNKTILAIIILLSVSNNYSMNQTSESNPNNRFEDSGSFLSDDNYESFNDDSILSEVEVEDDASYKPAIREFFFEHGIPQQEHTASSQNSDSASSNKSSAKDTPSFQHHEEDQKGPILIPYPSGSYSENNGSESDLESKNASQRVGTMQTRLNFSMHNFRHSAGYYANRDAAVSWYRSTHDRLSQEDRQRFANENPRLHKMAMDQIEYENRPPLGQRMKENFKSLGTGISSVKSRVSSWWNSSASNEDSKKQNNQNEYKNAAQEQSSHAHYNDYKNACLEQQSNSHKKQRQRDYDSLRREQSKFLQEQNASEDVQTREADDNEPLITTKEIDFLKEQAAAEKEREKELDEQADAERSHYDSKISELNTQFDIEQSQQRLDEIVRTINAPYHWHTDPESNEEKNDSSSHYLENLINCFDSTTEDRKDTIKTQGNANDIVTKDFIVTSRSQTPSNSKIVAEIIANPSTPKNVVAILERAEAFQNSTYDKTLKDLSMTVTEIIVYGETISKEIAKYNAAQAQAEVERYDTIKKEVFEIASVINDYVAIIDEESKKTQHENYQRFNAIIENPLQVGAQILYEASQKLEKLAVLIGPIDPDIRERLNDSDIAHLKQKSLEERERIVASIERKFSTFKDLPPQEKFRAAVKGSLNMASLYLIAQTGAALHSTMRANTLRTNARRTAAISAEKAMTAEVNEVLDASRKFAQSEKAKTIIDTLDKKTKNSGISQQKASTKTPSRQPPVLSSTVEIPERIKNFNPDHQKAIKEFPKDIVKQYKGHIFSKDHRDNGILNLRKNESEIIKKFSDIILESDQAGLIKAADDNTIHTIIKGQEVIIKARLDETGKVLSMNGYVKSSPNAASKGNTFTFIMKEYV